MTDASFMSQFKPIPSLGLRVATRWLEKGNNNTYKIKMLASDHEVIKDSRESYLAQEELLELVLKDKGILHTRSSIYTPLVRASLLVKEDLCIMLPINDIYQLSAAAVYSPSNWKLAEKFKQSIAEIHQKVPGFDEKKNKKIDNIFRGLLPDRILERHNWSIYTDPTLYQPKKLPGKEFYLRIERQTIRKLERSKGIVFTIGFHVDSLEEVLKDEHIAGDLKQAIAGLPQQVLDYKEMNYDYKRKKAHIS